VDSYLAECWLHFLDNLTYKKDSVKITRPLTDTLLESLIPKVSATEIAVLILLISVIRKLTLKWLVYGGHIFSLKPQIISGESEYCCDMHQHSLKS
jgi:hypothetical protein